jgi:ABC-type lipoprotein export system ATPase subunit
MVVRIINLHKSFRNGGETTRVLYGLDLTAYKGEMIMIKGPSGSGKTTFLNMVGGIDKPDQGTIEVSGTNITLLNTASLNVYRREKVGFIFQFYNLLPTLTSLENVELGLETLLFNKVMIHQRAEKYLRLVDLSDKMYRYPQELSAGQQQRVAIARALAKEPTLILADEPTGNLDEEREEEIMKLMKKLQHELGITFFIVSHNTRLEPFMDRTLELRHGTLQDVGRAVPRPQLIKKIQCPRCRNIMTVAGKSGEQQEVTCPDCNLRGLFSFAEDT